MIVTWNPLLDIMAYHHLSYLLTGKRWIIVLNTESVLSTLCLCTEGPAMQYGVNST